MKLLFFIGLADYAYMDAIELSIGQRRLLSLKSYGNATKNTFVR